MPSQALNSAALASVLDENEIVFIKFGAQWCAPCNAFAKAYEKVAEQFPILQFMKVNIEEQQDLADHFEIRSIPHLMIFKEGLVIYSGTGNSSESVLKALAQQALDLDISEIKTEVDKLISF